MGKSGKKKVQKMTKSLPILALALMLTVAVRPMVMAIDNGTYDYFGTFSLDAYFADGTGGDCALELANVTCPATVNFCIKNLDVTDNLITSNDPGPHYGIAIGIIDGTIDTDYDGTGAVSLTVGNSSADNVATSIDVTAGSGSCAAAATCVNSYSKSMEAPGGDADTVTGSIPCSDGAAPTTFPLCASGTGSYGTQLVTSETAHSRVSNENGSNQELSYTGSGLSGSDPSYSLKLVNPESFMRTTIGPIVLGTDVHTIRTFDGTLCRRTGSGTCIPQEFSCPAEDD